MGARERLPVEREHVLLRGKGRAPTGAAVGAHERLPVDETTCARAAMCEHLKVLQWAHANGCPWDAETFRMAAYGKHLEMMHWLRANGCPQS